VLTATEKRDFQMFQQHTQDHFAAINRMIQEIHNRLGPDVCTSHFGERVELLEKLTEANSTVDRTQEARLFKVDKRIEELEKTSRISEKLTQELRYNILHLETANRLHVERLDKLEKRMGQIDAAHLSNRISKLSRIVHTRFNEVEKRIREREDCDIQQSKRLQDLEAVTTDYTEIKESHLTHGQRINELEVGEGVATDAHNMLAKEVHARLSGLEKANKPRFIDSLNVEGRLSQLERAEGNAATRIEELEIQGVANAKVLGDYDDRLGRHWEHIASIILRADGVSIELGRDRGEIDDLIKKAEGLRLSIAMTDSVVKGGGENLRKTTDLVEVNKNRLDGQSGEVQHLFKRMANSDLRMGELEIAMPVAKVVNRYIPGKSELKLNPDGSLRHITSIDCQPHGRYTDLIALGERVADNDALGLNLRQTAQKALNVAKGGV
jgi:hypothetical protein